MQRVVITGLGCITPIGATPEALWQSLESGHCGITAFADPDPSIKFKTAGQIPHLNFETLTPNQLQTAERCSHLAILAARQAAAQSQLTHHHSPDRLGVFLGCSTNGRQAEEPEIARVYTQNSRVHPLTIARSMASNGVSQVAIDQQITGPALTVSTACASGAHAIGLAFQMIRGGIISAALAGGHEAPLTKAFLRAWDSMRVVSPTACRPFSVDRDGMTLAEGAAVLAIESLPSARARNAPILAEILGFGMATDAHHITQPRPAGPTQAIQSALADAARTFETTPEAIRDRIAYINAHATATQANDMAEAAAIHAVFGPRASHIPVSGTKGFHGHSLGASSAIETLITALALHQRRLPYTFGTLSPDPALQLDVILHTPRDLPPRAHTLALTNALAFGGLNAVLCLGTAPE